ncbi:hypothetical protein Tco_1325130 [Tanacetum coccineum]
MLARPRKKRIRSKGKGGISSRVYKGGNGGAKQGVAGASGSKQGSVGWSKQGSAGWSKRKVVSSEGTQKRQGKKRAGTSGFARWFGAQDDLVQTQDDSVYT